ncbi:MAG: hypothetical protein H6730_20395 [Deltaproteobacteria bacterium]|nr:hypothetical protein [Deltaproteobacteria bacterium]
MKRVAVLSALGWGLFACSATTPRPAESPLTSIDPVAIPLGPARAVFDAADRLCKADGGATWGASLCGPILLVDPVTRTAVGSQPDVDGWLGAREGLWVGPLTPEVPIANTAVTWSGVRWVALVWPLPEDEARRDVLLAHEMFHRIADEVVGPGDGMQGQENPHLDTQQGRYWLQLEWRALAAALSAGSEAARREAIAHALGFRAARRAAFAGSAASEDALELNEGLAEYTGVVCGRRGASEQREAALHDLRAHVDDPSFARSFAYATGPAYGLLLDRYAQGWRARVGEVKSLSQALAEAVGVPALAATDAAARYGGPELFAAEEARAKRQAEVLARDRQLLVEGPVLRLAFRHMKIEFDPRTVRGLEGLGSVYPTLRVVDDWGVLTVSDVALVTSDWSAVVVPAPTEAKGPVIEGPGWRLELASSWRLEADARAGDLRVSKHPE